MSMAWREDCRPSVDTETWRVVRVNTSSGQGKDYLVKGLFEEDGYHVMLTDTVYVAVWKERMGTDEILQRLKVLE